MAIVGIGTPFSRDAPPQHYEIEDLAPKTLVVMLPKHYPELAVVPGLLLLVVHVLRTPDRKSEIVYLPFRLLAAITGRETQSKNKKAVTNPVLSALRSALSSVGPYTLKGNVSVSPKNFKKGMATGFRLEIPGAASLIAQYSRDVPDDNRITISGWCRVRLDGTWSDLTDTSLIRKEMLDRPISMAMMQGSFRTSGNTSSGPRPASSCATRFLTI